MERAFVSPAVWRQEGLKTGARMKGIEEHMQKITLLALGLGALLMSEPAQASAADRTLDEVRALVKDAEAHGLVRKAKKTKPVDARPAKPGEVIVTVIAGEGKETQSRPAVKGDWVVRNRCEATGNEEYLVAADKFKERYQSTGKPAGPDGWQEYRPLGKVMRFLVLKPEHGEFAFTAPGASAWSRSRATRSSRTRRTPPTPIAWRPRPSPARTKKCANRNEREAAANPHPQALVAPERRPGRGVQEGLVADRRGRAGGNAATDRPAGGPPDGPRRAGRDDGRERHGDRQRASSTSMPASSWAFGIAARRARPASRRHASSRRAAPSFPASSSCTITSATTPSRCGRRSRALRVHRAVAEPSRLPAPGERSHDGDREDPFPPPVPRALCRGQVPRLGGDDQPGHPSLQQRWGVDLLPGHRPQRRADEGPGPARRGRTHPGRDGQRCRGVPGGPRGRHEDAAVPAPAPREGVTRADDETQSARRHFLALEVAPDQWAINEALAGIHASGLLPEDLRLYQGLGGSIVWSPLSNLLLYGATTDIRTARELGIKIGLGSDWSPTGSKNLLCELKVAWLYSQHFLDGLLSPRDLVAMVTRTAAQILRWDAALGSLEPGKRADLLVIGGTSGDPYEALVRATELSVRLVVINGFARYGTASLMRKLAPSHEPLRLKGQSRGLYLEQPTTHPAVAPISLAAARDTLRDGLARIQDLARDLERREQAPALEGRGGRDGRGVVARPRRALPHGPRDPASPPLRRPERLHRTLARISGGRARGRRSAVRAPRPDRPRPPDRRRGPGLPRHSSPPSRTCRPRSRTSCRSSTHRPRRNAVRKSHSVTQPLDRLTVLGL